MTVVLKAHHIEWDTDGEAVHGLPTNIAIELDLQNQEGWTDINSQICDQLSNITGYCVLDYQLAGFDLEAEYALKMTLTPGGMICGE